MSFFGKLFGGKKEEVKTTGEAIQELRNTEGLLMKKQEVLEKRIEQELDAAKKHGTKNKRGKEMLLDALFFCCFECFAL